MIPAVAPETARIVVAGAGSIGCFVGGLLASGGRSVMLLARPRIAEELSHHGMRLTDFAGLDIEFAPQNIEISTNPETLGSADVVLVAVKSGDTPTIADEIAAHCSLTAVVVSLQNGVDNATVLRSKLRQTVIGGMVVFNVVHKGQGRFHRGTSGQIVLEDGLSNIQPLFQVAGLDVETTTDIAGVQWGKLLVNLNNALNALSGIPLREQLQNRLWRRVLADQIEEALAVLRKAGISPVPPTPVPLRFIPAVLRLPTPVFRVVAARMLVIDPQARSSMWEDLERRRQTEIDFLQGAIVRLASNYAVETPVTQRIMDLVKKAEQLGQGSPRLAAEQVIGAQAAS